MVQIAGAALIFLALLIAGNIKFGWYWRLQEWRYGRKVDETLDWEAFNKAFEDTK